MSKNLVYSPSNPQKRIEEYPAFLIGKHPTKDAFLASYGQQFVMLAAPPGTGKGVGEVIPNALSYPDSMVINDPKFENWEITSGFRAFAGHKVFRFSPERLETGVVHQGQQRIYRHFVVLNGNTVDASNAAAGLRGCIVRFCNGGMGSAGH